MRRAQLEIEPVVWVQPEHGPLYPPDLAEAGIDLDALVVVHVPCSAGSEGLARAAELVLRSGAFGLVVVDLVAGTPRGDAWLGRLAGLARQHESRVVLLTTSAAEGSSVGPMVGLRLEPVRRPAGPGRFSMSARILKDKSGLGVRASGETHRGPWGVGDLRGSADAGLLGADDADDARPAAIA